MDYQYRVGQYCVGLPRYAQSPFLPEWGKHGVLIQDIPERIPSLIPHGRVRTCDNVLEVFRKGPVGFLGNRHGLGDQHRSYITDTREWAIPPYRNPG